MEVKVLFTGLLSPAQGVLSRWQETRREEGTPADLFARDIPGLSPAVSPYPRIPDMGWGTELVPAVELIQ